MSRDKGAASAAPEFPRTLAAVEEDEGKSKWRIADAILLELGEPSFANNDGAGEKMSHFLADHGHPDWATNTLNAMRSTAQAFRPPARRVGVSFETHREAGDPEMLEEAIRRNGDKMPSRAFVRQMKREMREAEETAERKLQADRRRRAEEAARKAREKERAAHDEQARIRAQEQARKAEARRLLIEQQQAQADLIREERRRKEAEAKAAKAAELLADKDVAEALARDRSVGARRITNAVHEKEAARRRKVREENDRQAQAGALPLPAFVPKMIGDIDAWVIALRSITDDDLVGLPDEPFVRQLVNVVEELADEAQRWNTALGRQDVIDGTVTNLRVFAR